MVLKISKHLSSSGDPIGKAKLLLLCML